MVRTWLLVVSAVACLGCGTVRSEDSVPHAADIIVYGATPAGIAAAISAAKCGRSVILADPTRHIGGMVTNGLTHTDFHCFEGLSGTFLEFTRRVHVYYQKKYGKESQQVRDCFRGTQFEPHVALIIFQQMLSEHPKISVKLQSLLAAVNTTPAQGRQRIVSAVFRSVDHKEQRISAACFIDASYEGDMMAKAGVKYRVGREGKEEFGETLAPKIADGQLQAYNFRLSMTRVQANRVTPREPAGYQRADFLELIPLLKNGRVRRVFGMEPGAIYKAQSPRLPNEKYDINDVSHSVVRLSMPGENLGWPDGDTTVRRRIFETHLRYNTGLLYFLQNDDAVPENFRTEAREWGWCKDEFVDNDHLPEQLYVRESRRMCGMYTFTEKDTDCAGNDWRAVQRHEAIAIGEYGPNCHGTLHEGPLFGGKHSGEFYKAVAPYQIPYGVIIPTEIENLIVPVACSASHVGFCALRLEPIWTSLGQAAGYAAHLSIKDVIPVQNVKAPLLQRALHADGSSTVFVSDVLPGSPDFIAAQWWATAGGLHGLIERQGKPGQRGKNISGQYFEANPGHTADLDMTVDDGLRKKWTELAAKLGVPAEVVATAKTRREFIRNAHGHLQR